ncbi:hypothetical protein [Pseudophaeobacter leonis]|uniref:hypothetical protein n=1 Tax=Pseudophaeobacter leonis TaxID=1144477 RepID=UPI0009F35DB5|nr:hypothetical protein [Pseudophaeobacter leonis]
MKTIVIHIGPHKTGTTSIQKRLSQETENLSSQGILFLHNPNIHEAALLLANERFEEAEKVLKKISTSLTSAPENTIILSQEDFSGNLIGRTRKRRVYPKLTKNIRIICRALRPHRIKFVFFERDEQEWMRSCYVQHLKHRTKFHSLSDFRDYYETGFKWSEKLSPPIEAVDSEFCVFKYSKAPSSGVTKILEVAGATIPDLNTPEREIVLNNAPLDNTIEILERINRLSSSTATAWFSKKLVLDGWKPRLSKSKPDILPWPPRIDHLVTKPIPKLFHRVLKRVTRQKVTNTLPEVSVDLSALASDTLPSDVTLPDIPRARMEDQFRILEYHLRGHSKLAHLNAMTISYLRRDTEHTELARNLFHRIWDETGALLVNELSTRWLISTLQTFMDHGKNEHQRLIGGTGYFYANMIKIYEGERSIEAREQDAIYEHTSPQTLNKFRGLDRFSVGGTDLMLNTNALLLEISYRDEVAGLVLQEFLLRVKASGNVFQRLDQTRVINNIEVPGFTDTWSFFERPPTK